ncbi:hypothetical protein SAMN05216474_0057 [Lishizhenia tianjinensis]|uniref:Uncharacterized protein n=2 Tax=Lishizhenia tianjinensis TaxID=477690 RepID=A0A1I6XB73_9FLAO|nr:hypothetical protein SAMN05216474_0057 [Lishizhenia tianjinensis]
MKFDTNKYKVYTWKNPLMLHWIINPALVINEILFGQKIPKVSLVDKTSHKPRVERSFVPCPHCETIHDGRTWSPQNGTAFKNWFGLYCNNCGEIIPCVNNVFSLLILALTFPIWGWFRKSLKAKWYEKQAKRYENLEFSKVTNPFDNKNWWITGLKWAAFMYVTMQVIWPLLDGTGITWASLAKGAVIWPISGIFFGFTMKLFTTKKGRRQKEQLLDN